MWTANSDLLESSNDLRSSPASAARFAYQGFATCVLLALTACASAPPEWVHTESVPSKTGVVAFAAAQVNPSVEIAAMFRGARNPGATGAAAGAVECLASMQAFPVNLLLMPVCAGIGAAAGASAAVPADALKAAERTITAQIAALQPQRKLLGYASDYANVSGLPAIAVLPPGKPTTLEAVPQYSLHESGRADTILELTLTKFGALRASADKPEYGFLLEARGRLIRVRDNVILDTFTRCVETNYHRSEEWLADGTKAFKDEIEKAMRELAEGFVDEWLLVYHAPEPEKALSDAQDRATSGYVDLDDFKTASSPNVLLPHYRVNDYSRRGTLPGMVPIVEPTHLRPTLRWESIPRSLTQRDVAGSTTLSAVVYDVRIYEASQSKPPDWLLGVEFWSEGPLVFSRYGLTKPELTLDASLRSCARYSWKVRARFIINGYRRATEWSAMGPTEWLTTRRRSQECMGFPRIYLGLIAPSATGASCQ